MSAPFTSNETPIKNQIEIMFLRLRYQKMMFNTKNTTTTTAAQKIGL